MTKYLCKCNNCDSILIDRNPQVNAIPLKTPENAIEMVMIGSPLEMNSNLFWACPICLTDEYLNDDVI
jgi:hypothetical protein